MVLPASYPVVLSRVTLGDKKKKQCWRTATLGLFVDAVCGGSSCAKADKTTVLLEE